MNTLVVKSYNDVGSRESYDCDFVNLEVEGAKELAILCPVSKLTGFPMDLQQVIGMINDKNSRLAEMLLAEIPQIPTDDRVSDEEKMKMLVSRLDTGSFFENDGAIEALGDLAKFYFDEAAVDKIVEQKKDSIEFNTSDVSTVDA